MATTTIFVESFETDGNGTRYTAPSAFNASPNDHFNRTDGSDIANSTAPYSNVDGLFYWAAEDQDGGTDALPTKTLTFAPIDTSGFTDLAFQGLFGVGFEAGSFDDEDFATVSYSLDGGTTFQEGITFRAVDDGGLFINNEPFALNGNPADGLLTTAMQEFGFTLPAAPSVIFLVETSLNAASEEFAFDNFRLVGEAQVGDATVEVTATDADAAEAGSDTGTFTFTRTGGDPGAPLAVSYAIAGDAGVTDYTPILSGTVVIPANETAVDLVVTPVDDDLVEPTESLELRVIDGAGYVAGAQATATVAIADNDVPPPQTPTVSLAPATLAVPEGTAGDFTLSRTGDVSSELFVTLNLNPDASLTPADFALEGNILVADPDRAVVRIPAGAAATNLTFTALADFDAETPESLTVSIADTADYDVEMTAATAIATIPENAPTVPTGTITVIQETIGGAATDFDFAGSLGAFTLDDATPDDGDAFGNQIVFDEVPVGEYTIRALPETGFRLGRLELSSTNANLNDDSASLTDARVNINLTPDEAVTVRFVSEQTAPPQADIDYAIRTDTTSLDEGDGGRQVIQFAVTRSGATEAASQVEVTLGGAATFATDYEFVSLTGATLAGDPANPTVEFAAGETMAVLNLAVLGDTTVEPDEAITATLANPTAPDTATISVPTATTVIRNDDAAAPPTPPDAGPILDLSDTTGPVTVTFAITREAALDNVIQFYPIADSQGTVAGLTPDAAGYADAALGQLVPGLELIGTDGDTVTRSAVLAGGQLYAPVLFVDGDRNRPLFAFDATNPGGNTQIISSSPNTFQFEDLVGGDDDFNDLLIEATIVGSEAPDTTTTNEFYDDLLEVATVFFDNLELSLSGLPNFLRNIVESNFGGIPERDELTGLVAEGIEQIQQSGVDGILYFYATDALGQVDGLPPTSPGYEDAVRDNFISEIALSDLVSNPLPLSIDLPDEPNYGVALILNTDPSNLLTIQDVIFPNNSSTDVVIVQPR